MTADNLDRLGKLIATIGNNPGIGPEELLAHLKACGHKISVRTLYSDLRKIKDKMHLIPTDGRMRSGYVLDGFVTIDYSKIPLLIDALEAFAVSLGDPEIADLLKDVKARRTIRDDHQQLSRRAFAHSIATGKIPRSVIT
ncbi:MAG: hypothetical protein K8F91_12815, partial [Candidatus Obscuribacterales bacterium]|nr:hypothetical protein [Candidatus Obscuribacterales bacterium]